jgi:hypothetical protein
MASRHVSSVVRVCTALVLIAGMTGSTSAAIIVYLDDLNSHVEFSPSSGVMSWMVDSIQQLKQQWFFYRLSGVTQEAPLSSLGCVKHEASDADYDPGNEMLNVVYANTVVQRDALTTVAETVITPAPLPNEVATYAATLAKLNDTSADNLNDSVGSLGLMGLGLAAAVGEPLQKISPVCLSRAHARTAETIK